MDPNGQSRLRVQPSLPAPRSRAEQAKRPPLRAPFKHCLEIRARPLRLEPGGLGCFAHTEIAVDQAGALMALGWYARSLKRIDVGFARVSQRIEPRRANDRRREPRKAFRARNAPVVAILGIVSEQMAQLFSA